MIKICKICKKEFYIIASRINTAKYCSLNCYNKKGIIHPLWGKHHSEKTKQKMRFRKLGKKLSKKHRKNLELSHKGIMAGSKNPRWKGGRQVTNDGYILIYTPNHPYKIAKNYVYEHRFVMEQKLGRYLKFEETVHHINGIKDDNRIENLMVFSNGAEHTHFHHHSISDKKPVKLQKLQKFL